MISCICLDENLACMLKKQITSLVITMDNDKLERTREDLATPLFIRVLNMFTNLCKLDFHSCSSIYYGRLYFDTLGHTLSSSTLMELHVNVCRFEYCLLLLDHESILSRYVTLHEQHNYFLHTYFIYLHKSQNFYYSLLCIVLFL